VSSALQLEALLSPLNPKRLSFFSRWNGEVASWTEVRKGSIIAVIFGYIDQGGETETLKAVAAIWDSSRFSLETRSMIWNIAEIKVKRQNEWVVFSRNQNDLSPSALEEFLLDSANFLEHLKDESKRLHLNA
jgi:hypothetical protein